jgi:hypothetical protein
MISPRQGNHLHDWILQQSRNLLLEGYNRKQVVDILEKATVDSRRTTQDIHAEIENAVEGAEEFLENNPNYIVGKRSRRARKWNDPLDWIGLDDPLVRKDRRAWRLPVDRRLIEEIVRKGRIKHTLDDFHLGVLFFGIDLNICGGKETWSPIVKPLRKWLVGDSWERMQYVVPNYFLNCGKGKGVRNDVNIGERLYVVVEFDQGGWDQQLKLLHYLSNKAFRLVLIVYSGGKSLHGWFTCYDQTEHKVKSFCRLACKLGADKTTRSPSQWVRMPNGYNYKTERSQEVVYYDEKLTVHHANLVRDELL